MNTTTVPERGIGAAFIVIGLLLVAISADCIAVPAESITAPRWVLGAVGVVVMVAGLLAGRRWSGQRVNRALAASLLTMLGMMGGWVSLYGRAEGFRMGVGDTEPTAVMSTPAPARIMFGFGALVTIGWAAVIWREVFQLKK